tara:strand:+ start:2809 stop:3738 length:930 start_codon:yes stop_codon:yes gene_type:complete
MILNTLIDNLTHFKNLELSTNIRFELYQRNCQTEYNFSTLRNAMKNNEVSISEINDSGSVPHLKCKSYTEKLVLILAGEEIVGAKQNRITNISFIVPPFKEIIIPVSCVEQGRWRYETSTFSKGFNAYPDLKRKLYEDVTINSSGGRGFTSNQSRVWNDIEEKQRSFNKFSSTSAMNRLYKESEAVNRFLNQNKNINACGMTTYINGSIVSFECAPNNIFFNQLFPDLVDSIYQESLLYKNTSKTYSNFFSTNAYFNYLKKIDRHLNIKDGVGLGKNYHILSRDIIGDALELDGDLIHFYSFPKSYKNC